MIKAFKIKNHLGESIYIDIRKPEATGFLITSVEGLGPVKAEISQTETAMFDGSLFSGCRLEPRNIVMNLLFFWDNNEKISIEDIRYRSYIYFPVKKEIEVTVINDHGEFKINGVVETNEPPIFSDKEGTQISILCSDPYFEKEEDNHLHYISRVVPNFQFPVSFEAEMIDVPPEEEQEDDIGLQKIVDEQGNVYWKYAGPYSVTSEAFNNKTLNLAGKFLTKDITVNEIPYKEEENSSGGLTIKIGGTDGNN